MTTITTVKNFDGIVIAFTVNIFFIEFGRTEFINSEEFSTMAAAEAFAATFNF